MCLYIKSGVHEAQTDIHVFKVLEPRFSGGRYITPFFFTPVNFNPQNIATMKSELLEVYDDDSETNVVRIGIHSFVNLKAVENYDFNRFSNTYHFCNAVIPKGARYYIGVDDDVVSDRLVIFENEEAYEKHKETHEVTEI